MNWATPCAPAGLTAVGLNALSRQMSRVKKPTGSPSDMADDFDDPAQGRERVVGFGTGVAAGRAFAQPNHKRGKGERFAPATAAPPGAHQTAHAAPGRRTICGRGARTPT